MITKRDISRGAIWRQWDLHVHTPASFHWSGDRFDVDLSSAKSKKLVDEMIEARKKANKQENIRTRAITYCDEVKAFFEPIRDHVDALEMLVDDEIWPMAKYRELVTIR